MFKASAIKTYLTFLPRAHQLLLLTISLGLVFILLSSSNKTIRYPILLPPIAEPEAHGLNLASLSAKQLRAPWALDPVPKHETLLIPSQGNAYQYIVRKGDTLSDIFQKLHIPQSTLLQLLDADVNVLALDNLMPGHTLTFEKQNQILGRLELNFNLAHKVIYQRKQTGEFEFEEVQLTGDWQDERVQGAIINSFSGSSQKAGLSAKEAQLITEVLKQRVDFRRDIQANDRFEILLERQYVDGEATGSSRVAAIRIMGRRHNYQAYLFNDNYFDEKGRNLEKAFQRYPFNGKYRQSSGFNPRRKHPVTGLIRPHNGTDFAMRIGTPVRATGDGIVKRVVRHKYAGLYIEIQHGQSYKTRYLHLKKSYVIKGQRVKRGQKIALSGNSGRSTAPHLHFELHVNGRPVNPMTAKIPIAVALTGKKKKTFQSQQQAYIKRLEQAAKKPLAKKT